MRASTIIFCVLALTAACCYADDDQAWKEYKAKHGRKYTHGSAHDKHRKSLFQKTDKLIKEHPEKLVHNEFSDMTDEEKAPYVTEFPPHPTPGDRGMKGAYDISAVHSDRITLPLSVDLRSDPCMSPIKNQGRCGLCWAFSTTSMLEFGTCKRYGSKSSVKPPPPKAPLLLSEQQLGDCVGPKYGRNTGCNFGGWPANAVQYITDVNGVDTAASTPYLQASGTCRYPLVQNPANPTVLKNPGGRVASSAYVNPNCVYYNRDCINSAPLMQKALADKFVLSVAIYVEAKFYQLSANAVYTFTDCDNRGVNHAVNVVGYGTDATTKLDYWIVRNSWGIGWCDKGYFKMQRGVNKCNIERYPYILDAQDVYPFIKWA